MVCEPGRTIPLSGFTSNIVDTHDTAADEDHKMQLNTSAELQCTYLSPINNCERTKGKKMMAESTLNLIFNGTKSNQDNTNCVSLSKLFFKIDNGKNQHYNCVDLYFLALLETMEEPFSNVKKSNSGMA